ncbi:MAG: hypothetical protein U1F61_20065 [Opitutaceae bacterium]
MVETLGIGCHAVDRANLESGEFVLVIGVGLIGLAVMQFAVEASARVIVLDINENRLRFCREHLGSNTPCQPPPDPSRRRCWR